MFLNNLISKLFRNQNRVEYVTGKALPLEKIYLSELEKYPIWIYALDNEENYEEDQDETWLEPITNSTNVTKQLVEAYILLKIKENDCPAFGHLDIQKMQLDDLWYWDYANKDWKELRLIDVPLPIHLISNPSLLDQAAVEFIVNEDKDSANRLV